MVILDNGRSELLGTDFGEVLRCIRCGACMNHCPVYTAIGGHAYGWVYPGPIGAVLTPALIGVHSAGHLPNASTFCGRCEEVCPMKIPLPGLMRHWREEEFEAGDTPPALQAGAQGLGGGGQATAPLSLGWCGLGMPMLGAIGRRRGRSAACRFARGVDQASRSSPPRRAARSRRCGPTPKPACRDDDGAGDGAGPSSPRSGRASARMIRQARRATVARRLAEPAQPLVPERAKKQADERRRALRTFLEGQSATFVEVAGAADVPAGDRAASCAPPTCRCGCASATTLICADSTGTGSPRSSA